MLSISEVTDIFYLCDELASEFNKYPPSYLLKDRIMLRQRAVIESVNDELKTSAK